MTEWREVPQAPGRYSVSSDGQVRNDKTGLIRKLSPNGDGYLNIDWNTDGIKRHFRVHVLVLSVFVSERPEGMEGCHRNGDLTDNSVANLYWGTHAENMRDRVAHGTNPWANKTQCPAGHRYEGDNVEIRPNGARRCVACRRKAGREAARERRARAVA